jgi:monofunctional biosynthetic peptidoglycan transglycosylase
VARDIAFVADKDTRDDLGAFGDPIPVADVPPSEGGPATRDPSSSGARASESAEPRTPEKSETPPTAPPGPALRADAQRIGASEVTEPVTDGPEAGIVPDLPDTAPQAFELDTAPHFDPPAPQPDLRAPDLAPDTEPALERLPEPEVDTAAPANEAHLQAYEPAPLVEVKGPDPEDAPPAIAEPAEEAPPASVDPAEPPEATTAPLAATTDDHGAWRTAIADALFEPSPSPQPEPAPSESAAGTDTLPSFDPAAEPPSPERDPPPSTAESARLGNPPVHTRASIELLPERRAPEASDLRAPSEDPASTDWQLEARPAPSIEPERLPPVPETAQESIQSDASFTAAAEDLFRPPEIERDPHLITLGRRLDPSLRIPRPVPPVIAPRYEPDPDSEIRPTWKTGSWQDRLWIAGRYAAYAAGGYLALVLVLIVLFRFVNPPGSMLMLTKLLTGNSVDRTWVPLDQISPNLVRAVIVSEDGRFCEHSGIDTLAIKDAIEKASGGVARGASTISMQVTKNLFLWNAKSYIRKVIEIPLTLVMEIVWPKRRILEMYLNIAEWGPGVFGAEAAARHHFNKPAYRLNEREAALLAAVLPNPVRRDAGSPNTLTSSKARVVQARVKAYGAIAACVVGPRSRAASPAEPSAAAPGSATATPRNQPARKTPPQRKAPRRETIEDWGATVRMGPQ